MRHPYDTIADGILSAQLQPSSMLTVKTRVDCPLHELKIMHELNSFLSVQNSTVCWSHVEGGLVVGAYQGHHPGIQGGST
eukprot:11579311-Karenia_brevis.AAC.1